MSINKQYGFASLLIAAIFAFLFILLDYPENEGFNPSDDGVILAQSHRIINGEIPHVDFISIRPAFSGILHTVHFWSPLPLEVSARWFVILEFFIYSLVWTLILMRLINTFRKNNLLLFLGLLVLIFILNLSMYNLFPWTTLDAIMFASLGTLLWLKGTGKNEQGTSGIILIPAGLFLIGISSLCRQNFVFLTIVFSLLTIFHFYKTRSWLKMFLALIFAGLPVIVYLLVLAANNGVDDFIVQMTGRTELVKTGVLTFVKRFTDSTFLPWYLVMFLLFGLTFISRKLKERISLVIEFIPFINVALSLTVTSILFFMDVEFLFSSSFEMFWLFLFTYINFCIFQKEKGLYIRYGFLILLFGWVSSISLGDNAPVFVMGIMLGAILVFNISLVLEKKIFRKKTMIYFIILFPIFITAAGVFGQRTNNYRDLPANELKYELGEIYEGFGGIKTNENTYNYYKELREILDQNPQMKDHFVVIPNNPMIYAITGSRNPMPLDWMQHDEYVGSEERIAESLTGLIQSTDTVWFIIDKFDSKKLSSSLQEMDYSTSNHEYYDLLTKMTSLSEKNYRYFIIRF